ncbi:MAG: macro domain-containing protein [Candidatus Saccharimonadales bacterium]
MRTLRLEEMNWDITKLHADIIVNAANTQLIPGGGVDSKIHSIAGPELANACKELGGCDYGEAKITEAYDLPAQYVIHTVAPIYGYHKGKEPKILYKCFYTSLELADDYGVESMAFPALGSGLHGNPYEDVIMIAQKAVEDFADRHPNSSLKRVVFVHYTTSFH